MISEVSVRCPGCGRAYANARVASGRTFRCACGAQVYGAKARIPLRRPLRFAADAMLGALARRLRILGFDTFYDPSIDDERLVARAFAQQRLILTRDRRLARDWHIDGILCLAAERTDEQLRELSTMVPLARDVRLFTRCSVCNTELVEAAREQALRAVPASVATGVSAFARCPSCGRWYWEGSHTRRMREQLAWLAHG